MSLFKTSARPSLRRTLKFGLCTLLGALAMAPAAHAGTIKYQVAEQPGYFVVDNNTGIVKLTFVGCVTAGQRQTINFQTHTNVGQDSTATFKVLREEGEEPTSTFTPATVNLVRGPDQTFAVSLAFTLSTATDKTTTFRFKLDPASGEGLGEGAGVMVNIPCVQPKPFQAPAGPPVTKAGPVAVVPVPSAVAGAAQGPARCVRIDRVTLRAGVRNRVVVRVTRQGQPVRRALVVLRGAGVDRRAFTNSNGRAIFEIKPRRKGTLFVQSNVCRGADRLAVLGAAASPVAGGGANFTG